MSKGYEVKKKFIVKVQTPLATNARWDIALVYNQDRSIWLEIEQDEHIRKKMDGEPKKFFYAEISNTKIKLLDEAAWQDW